MIADAQAKVDCLFVGESYVSSFANVAETAKLLFAVERYLHHLILKAA